MDAPDLGELVAALHRAADQIDTEGVARAPLMDTLARAGGEFLASSNVTDEYQVAVPMDPASIGYGIMLGWLAREERG